MLTKVKHEPQKLVFRDTEFSATGNVQKDGSLEIRRTEG